MSMQQTSIFDPLPEEEAKEHKPLPSTDWKWSFKDYPPKNGLKVFSCFACGGGSTMGYKLAGCEVLGCVEIDKAMYDLYVTNHHPKYGYNMDIRDFNKIPDDQLPPELFDLDIPAGLSIWERFPRNVAVRLRHERPARDDEAGGDQTDRAGSI